MATGDPCEVCGLWAREGHAFDAHHPHCPRIQIQWTGRDPAMEELEKFAREATPGPWEWNEELGPIETVEDGYPIAHIHPHANIRTVLARGEEYSHANARFIAAANPQRVLDLIARVRKAEAALASLPPGVRLAAILPADDDLDDRVARELRSRKKES